MASALSLSKAYFLVKSKYPNKSLKRNSRPWQVTKVESVIKTRNRGKTGTRKQTTWDTEQVSTISNILTEMKYCVKINTRQCAESESLPINRNVYQFILNLILFRALSEGFFRFLKHSRLRREYIFSTFFPAHQKKKMHVWPLLINLLWLVIYLDPRAVRR